MEYWFSKKIIPDSYNKNKNLLDDIFNKKMLENVFSRSENFLIRY